MDKDQRQIEINNINMLKGEVEKQIEANRTRIQGEEAAKLAKSGKGAGYDNYKSTLARNVASRMEREQVAPTLTKEILSDYGGSIEEADKRLGELRVEGKNTQPETKAQQQDNLSTEDQTSKDILKKASPDQDTIDHFEKRMRQRQDIQREIRENTRDITR